MNTINSHVLPVTRPTHAGEDVYLVAFALKRSRELCYVNGDAANGNRVQ
jgi:hypothetical protein